MQETIIQAISSQLIEQDITHLKGSELVSLKHFSVYTAKAQQIPNVLLEIGRLREITYREVGEGTGKSIDIDEFDEDCDHIFIWDTEKKNIVGAYRILSGKEIMKEKGIGGFYISTLFHFDEKLAPLLAQTLELGRSFIISEYQKRPTPLFILWKALLFSILNSDARYLLGPVSMSGEASDEAKSLSMIFLQHNYCQYEIAKYVTPKNEYHPILPKGFNEKSFLEKVGDDFVLLDKHIRNYEDGYTTPTLIKQYISLLDTTVIGLNVDPDFNNCLDALMLMDLTRAPKATIENLVKDHPNPSIFHERLKNIEARTYSNSIAE